MTLTSGQSDPIFPLGILSFKTEAGIPSNREIIGKKATLLTNRSVDHFGLQSGSCSTVSRMAHSKYN